MFFLQDEDLGNIRELSNENDSSDDEGLEFDESGEELGEGEETDDGSENDNKDNEPDEDESDSGTMFSDDIEWETESESESKNEEKKEKSKPVDSKRSTSSSSTTSSSSPKGKSLKKNLVNSAKFDRTDNESSKPNQSKDDEYGEGDTSDEEVSCNFDRSKPSLNIIYEIYFSHSNYPVKYHLGIPTQQACKIEQTTVL